jgi:hypothetical protein
MGSTVVAVFLSLLSAVLAAALVWALLRVRDLTNRYRPINGLGPPPLVRGAASRAGAKLRWAETRL